MSGRVLNSEVGAKLKPHLPIDYVPPFSRGPITHSIQSYFRGPPDRVFRFFPALPVNCMKLIGSNWDIETLYHPPWWIHIDALWCGPLLSKVVQTFGISMWIKSGRIIPTKLHPWKLTCPLKRNYFSREYIFQPLIFRGHVSFQGSTSKKNRSQRLPKNILPNLPYPENFTHPKPATTSFFVRIILLMAEIPEKTSWDW